MTARCRGYYSLFERAWKRFLRSGPSRDSSAHSARLAGFAHWDVEASGPNWQVATRCDFLRREHMSANMAEPLSRQIPRALGWALDYLVTGTIVRVFRASWEFGIALIHFQLQLFRWIVLSVGGGWLVAYALMHFSNAAT